MILVTVSSAGDQDVKVRQVKSRRPIALPVRAIRLAALLARSIAIVMGPPPLRMLFAGPSRQAMAKHGLIIAA